MVRVTSAIAEAVMATPSMLGAMMVKTRQPSAPSSLAETFTVSDTPLMVLRASESFWVAWEIATISPGNLGSRLAASCTARLQSDWMRS